MDAEVQSNDPQNHVYVHIDGEPWETDECALCGRPHKEHMKLEDALDGR